MKNILDLYVSVANKTHAEGVAESMCNFTQKRKGVWIFHMFELKPSSTGMAHQFIIRLLLEEAMDQRFKGSGLWRFVTKENKLQSKVVSRLSKEVSRVPFFD